MSTSDADELLPDGFADGLDDGYVDLPWESGSPDPQPLEYADLPEVGYDPGRDWRDTQKQAMARLSGEFAPQEEEATDG